MKDPFPFAAPQFLQRAITPLAKWADLPTLTLHIHEIVFSILLYTVINTVVSPRLSTLLCPKTYPHLDRRTRINWDVHVVSLFQSVLICGLSFWSFAADTARKTMGWEERLWGYTGMGGFLSAMAVGYFIWDFAVTARHVHIFGWGMLAHAVAATAVFSLGFRPFVNYYAPVFLMFELSSPFNNFHWFMDKLKLTGSVYQWVNGIVLIATFFGCRLAWGTYNSTFVFSDMYTAYRKGAVTAGSPVEEHLAKVLSRSSMGRIGDDWDVFRYTSGRRLPLWLWTSYLAANAVLNTLNVYWMGKMVETIRKRFDPPFGTKGVEKGKARAANGGLAKGEPSIMRGVDAEGRKSIEIEGSEVRSRRRG